MNTDARPDGFGLTDTIDLLGGQLRANALADAPGMHSWAILIAEAGSALGDYRFLRSCFAAGLITAAVPSRRKFLVDLGKLQSSQLF